MKKVTKKRSKRIIVKRVRVFFNGFFKLHTTNGAVQN